MKLSLSVNRLISENENSGKVVVLSGRAGPLCQHIHVRIVNLSTRCTFRVHNSQSTLEKFWLDLHIGQKGAQGHNFGRVQISALDFSK